MNRREFLFGTAGLTCSGAMLAPALALAQADGKSARGRMIAGWKGRIGEILGRGRLPIIDVQATYVANMTNVPRIVEQMNELDVAQIVFAAANAPNSAPSLNLHRKHPTHFIPATSSGEFPRWWNGPKQFVAGLANDLRTGSYYMMGEHEFRHYPSPEQAEAGRKDRDITIDIAGPAGHALFQLSERTGISFQIHYEIEDRLLPALESMLARYPKAKVIWCHLAMIRYPNRAKKYNPAYVVSLIERFPNLHFDLATPQARNIYKPSGARDGTLYDFPSGDLNPDWKAVLEKYPERFVAASDYRPQVEQFFPMLIRFQRRLLDQVGARTRELLAYGNAWRLITGTSWTA